MHTIEEKLNNFKNDHATSLSELSPENVSSELEKIADIVPLDAVIFVDAEGKLKGDDGHFDYAKARKYVANALSCPATQS